MYVLRSVYTFSEDHLIDMYTRMNKTIYSGIKFKSSPVITRYSTILGIINHIFKQHPF